MKIQKGKLSASNAAMISVLLIVLYLVLPSGTNRKDKTQANSAPSESPVTTQTPPETTISIVPKSDQGTNDNPAEVGTTPVVSASPTLKDLSPFRKEDLDLLQQQNPFFTSAMIAMADSLRPDDKPQETSPAENPQTQPQNLVSLPKISLVYKSSTGKQAAILDDKVVYNGTVITGNVQVMSISEQGVQLSP